MEPLLTAMDCSQFTHACSVLSDFATPWTVAHQPPCPWTFPDKNTGAGCYSFTSGDLPDPEIESESLAPPSLAGGFFTTSAPLGGKSQPVDLQGSPMACFLKQILNFLTQWCFQLIECQLRISDYFYLLFSLHWVGGDDIKINDRKLILLSVFSKMCLVKHF